MDEKMIAMCGLVCTECPAFVATQSDNNAKRKEVAEAWSSEKHQFTPEEINCDGCLSTDGRLLSFCNECDIRNCAFEKEVANCAHCSEYACETLDKMFDQTSKARKNLDEIRKGL
jgi:hypothetical protein